MGFRFGRSIKVMPGVRLNVSTRGIGVSAGVPGARISVGPGGRVTRTLSVPGTGLSHVSTLSGGRRSSPPRSRSSSSRSSSFSSSTAPSRRRPSSVSSSAPSAPPAAPVPPAAVVPPRPGFLASAVEKAFFKAVTTAGGVLEVSSLQHPLQALAQVATGPGRGDGQLRLLCAALEGLWHFAQVDLDDEAVSQRLRSTQPGVSSGAPRGPQTPQTPQTPQAPSVAPSPDAVRARHLLGWVVAEQAKASAGGSALNLAEHDLAKRYLSEVVWGVEITHGVSASLGLAADVVHLAAAELHQAAGDLDAAIWTVENAPHPATPTALSLTELYSDAGRHLDVVDLTNAITNADDATALLLVFRARALAATGHPEAARECLKDAMRSRSRSLAVRHRALLERAEVNLASGRKAAARKDLEMILADDADFPGLTEALANLPAPSVRP